MRISHPSRRRVVGLAAAAAFAGVAPALRAQGFPNKPVRIIVAYAPGGANDIAARLIGQLLGERLKQPFVVENRPGASGSTGTGLVAKSPADGYTLLLGAGGTMTMNPGLFDKLPYDPVKDFAPIGLAARSPLVVLVPPALPVKNISELVAYAKSKPEGITYASPGAGTPLHLAGELFTRRAGVKTLHVPYKGSIPALTDLMAGRVDLMFDVQGSSLQFVRGGKLRALGVTSLERSRHLPDVATLHEQGLKDFDVTSWFGLFAPAGTPREVVALLESELAKAVATPEARERLAPLGMDPAPANGAQLGALVAAEGARWGELIRQAGIKPE